MILLGVASDGLDGVGIDGGADEASVMVRIDAPNIACRHPTP
jgi:hypothetical protein